MVSSADGAATTAGRSGGLSGPADRVLFGVLRSLADAILVGASTARIERYRPPGRATIWPQLRQGRPPLPRIAVVTGRLALDLTTPLFNPAPGQPPTIVITTESAPAERMTAVSKQAELIIAGAKQVEVGTALAALASRGYGQILTEGGPALLAELAAAGTLSELCLTISPRLEGGLSPRIINPAAPDTASADPASPLSALKLMTVLEHDGSLLCRYEVG
jgi:riboflavin biosynthesis pyrimidine reductase